MFRKFRAANATEGFPQQERQQFKLVLRVFDYQAGHDIGRRVYVIITKNKGNTTKE